MPFSHHSHSGQFCAHAQGLLQEMVQTAVNKKMHVFALTEHMPRDQDEDLYPEEKAAGTTVHDLRLTFNSYYQEACRLREAYRSQITILVGTETDWIRPSDGDLIRQVRAQYDLDFVVGSVHHVHEVPIDLDRQLYARAAELSRKKRISLEPRAEEEQLFLDYFDDQMAMLQTVKPTVVGHFDLIRLLSQSPNASLTASAHVWNKVQQNLEFVHDYGGFLEINTSGLRKGLAEPYPSADVCKTFVEMGGRFVLSDDSHNVGQIGFGYADALRYLEAVGITHLSSLTPQTSEPPHAQPLSSVSSVEDLWEEPFFTDGA